MGQFTGRQLKFVPVEMIAWADFEATYPNGQVLSRETGFNRNYGRNPYTGYDNVSNTPFLFNGPTTPDALPAMAWVITVDVNGEAVAYPYAVLTQVRVVNDSVGAEPIVVLWAPGTASALDTDTIAAGSDVGSATVFSRDLDGQTLTFVFDGNRFRDEQTGSQWDAQGRSIAGSMEGSVLHPVVHINHFWFSWAAFKPQTRIYAAPVVTPTPSPGPTRESKLESDFKIALYQGTEALDGDSVPFSSVLALGKPVILNLWAGLCPPCRTEMPYFQVAHERHRGEALVAGWTSES